MRNVGILIAGGGLAGLSTAWHLNDRPYLLVEKEIRTGGLVRSEVIRGCTFDITGHWLHLRNDHTRAMVSELLGDGLVQVSRKALILSHDRYVNYPFQSNLADLPSDVAALCAVDAVSAALAQASGNLNTINTFKDFALAHFGAGITREFIEPYNAKLWGVGIDEVTSDWCDRFVPVPDVLQIVRGAIQGRGQRTGYNATFLYPREGGIESLPKALTRRLPGDRILTGKTLRAVKPRQHQALVDDEWLRYDVLVSSLPLPVLAGMLEDMDEKLKQAARGLRASRLVYAIGAVRGEPLIQGAHWLYLPQDDIPVYRFGVPSNVLSTLAPAGMSSFYAEFTPGFDGDEQEARKQLGRVLGLLGRDVRDLDFLELRRFPYGYVIFDEHRNQGVAELMSFFEQHAIHSIGRFGAWTYNAMEDALLDGRDTAQRITGEADGN